MAKVHYVKKAAKDNPAAGIQKGDSYYWWQAYRQPKQYSKEQPKPSQVASNECMRQVLALVEQLEAWEDDPWTDNDRDELVSSLESIRDEEQEKYDNLPEGFQMGDTGLQIEENVNALDEWIDELQSIDFEETDSGAALQQALDSAVSF